MRTEGVRVDVGAWDWQSPAWGEEYYPEDLPQEWRAAYYTNEFRCAGLPAAAWSAVQLRAWREDLPEHFALWLECGPAQLADPEVVPALAALGSRLSGIWLGGRGDPAALRASGIRVIEAPWDAGRRLGEAAVGLYRADTELDLRAAREVLEAFAAAPGPQCRQLLVTGAPAQLSRLRELGELLGF
ncbi:MAG: hypothetical protein P8011_12720 [Acidihalobacter sp.]|uniref:hypothetical protein n=1 Tax=Acidihalobacter sp. TaxID=1872108 RepID=UPI00307EADBD